MNDISSHNSGPMRLNLGSGEDRHPGFLSIDWNSFSGADILQDLNRFPYPFAESSIDEIHAFHILEHLDRPFDVMRELHRILKPGGLLHVKVPHFSRGFTHPEHSHGFDITFPLYFDARMTRFGYFGVHFKLEAQRLRWFAFPHLMRAMGYSRVIITALTGIGAVLSFVANLSPGFASRVWCYWVGGFDEIDMRFTCVK